MAGASSNEVGVSRSQVSLRSAEDASRWLEILSESPEGPSTVCGLHVSGAESFPSLSTWPELENLHHLQLRGIDFRDLHESLTAFFDAYGSSIDELVLERLRFQEADGLFALISPFKNLTSLVIHDVEWGDKEFLDDDESESGPGSDPEDVTHKHTMRPGDCCLAVNRGLTPQPVEGASVDLPTLRHLSLRGCSSTIAKRLAGVPSNLHLSRLEVSWEDEHLFPLSEMIEACAPSLLELSISGVFHTECDYPLSLSACTRLSSLYLNGIHLFLDESLGPALHHLASTFPMAECGGNPRSIKIGFNLDTGPAWESRIDDVDWDAAGTALASLESRLDKDKDHWNVTMKVDSSYLAISEDEERRILDVAGKKLERFAAVLQLGTC